MTVPEIPDPPAEGLVFIETEPFTAMADEHLGDDGRQKLQNTLLKNPKAGAVIPGTGAARKLRVSLEGRGKRGGGRVIYYFMDKFNQVYFLLLYPKNEQETLSPSDKKSLKSWIDDIDSEV